MIPDANVLDAAKQARETGFFARLGRSSAPAEGMAAPGALLAHGRDALSFLHSQVTNEVEELRPGQGNFSARVTRTGQLSQFFTLHRLPDSADGAASLLLVLERGAVRSLLEELDQFLFADAVELLDVSDDYHWSTLQGPASASVADTALPRESGSWSGAPAHSIHPVPGLTQTRALAIARSLTGDPGLLFAVPRDESERFEDALERAAKEASLAVLEEPALSRVLEVLRIEAGQVRVGPDTAGRKSILPETGMEQHAVSYTKGCYLGQEVIARVRTYGALPYGLRGLVLGDAAAKTIEAQTALLERLPAPGGDLFLADGKRIGQIVSRTLSPVLGRPIAFAYLDKAHRTPGSTLELQTATGAIDAQIVLLPFHHAPDRDDRVASLYDRAIRIFAAGKEEDALALLEDALKLDPSFSDGYEALGVILGRSERFHEAIDIFRKLEEIAPNEPIVNTNLSLYYMKIGDKTSAETEAAKAMQKGMAQARGGEVESHALEEKIDAQMRSDAERKKKMFAQVLEIDPDDGVALFGMGNAHATLEEWEQAEALYAAGCAAAPDNSALFLARGKALEKLERPAEALEVFRAGMDVASRRGDLMPLKEMEHRVLFLSALHGSDSGTSSLPASGATLDPNDLDSGDHA